MGYIGNSYSQQLAQPATQFFSGNNSTTTFILNQTPQSVYTVEVVVNNVQQNPQTSYYVNGNSLIFYSPPPTGSSNIYVNYNPIVSNVNIPGYGSVNTNQLGVINNINSALSNLTLQAGGNLIVQTGTTSSSTALNIDTGGNIIFGTNSSPGTNNGSVVKNYSFQGIGGNVNVALQTDTIGRGGLLEFRRTGRSSVPRFAQISAVTDSSDNGYMYFYTAAAGADVTQQALLDYGGRFTLSNQPFARVYMRGLTNYTVANQTIVFNDAQVNTGSCYNTSNGRFTCPVAGKYLVISGIEISPPNTDWTYNYFIRKNGSAYFGVYEGAPAKNYWKASTYGIVDAAANDYIDLYLATNASIQQEVNPGDVRNYAVFYLLS
jgi:hypothetical protein